jgi:hypothetical protein
MPRTINCQFQNDLASESYASEKLTMIRLQENSKCSASSQYSTSLVAVNTPWYCPNVNLLEQSSEMFNLKSAEPVLSVVRSMRGLRLTNF